MPKYDKCRYWAYCYVTLQEMFPIKDFFSKCDQIRRTLRIWSHLLKKYLIEDFMVFVQCILSSHVGNMGKIGTFQKY